MRSPSNTKLRQGKRFPRVYQNCDGLRPIPTILQAWMGRMPSARALAIRLADQAPGFTDLFQWRRVEATPDPLARPPGGRDPFLFRDRGRWLLFSVGVRANHGQIVVTSNEGDDLGRGWSDEAIVLEDPVPSFAWGNLESPFVVELHRHYYLFLTRTGQDAPTDYNLTLVFRSADPRRFAWQPIAELRAHAAEIVEDGGALYLTSGGWPSAIGEKNRGLSLAPLGWVRH